MDFRELSKFIKNVDKAYGIPGCDVCVYYNHINVFRCRSGHSDEGGLIKTSDKNLYFMHSGAKIMCCVAIMQLAQRYKLSLNDRICDYIPGFREDVSVREMIREYSSYAHNEDKEFGFLSMKKLVEAASGTDFYEYITENITKPLKMKSTTFTLNDKNRKRIAQQYNFDKKHTNAIECNTDVEELHKKHNGCLITNVDDYALFCEAICSGGISKNGYRLLNKESVEVLINDIVYKETEKDDAFVCIGHNGSLVLIDIKKKITIVYAQHIRNMGIDQLEMYPKLRKMVYECIGVDTWSKGYNIFP